MSIHHACACACASPVYPRACPSLDSATSCASSDREMFTYTSDTTSMHTHRNEQPDRQQQQQHRMWHRGGKRTSRHISIAVSQSPHPHHPPRLMYRCASIRACARAPAPCLRVLVVSMCAVSCCCCLVVLLVRYEVDGLQVCMFGMDQHHVACERHLGIRTRATGCMRQTHEHAHRCRSAQHMQPATSSPPWHASRDVLYTSCDGCTHMAPTDAA